LGFGVQPRHSRRDERLDEGTNGSEAIVGGLLRPPRDLASDGIGSFDLSCPTRWLALVRQVLWWSVDQRAELRLGESVNAEPSREELRPIERALRAPPVRAASARREGCLDRRRVTFPARTSSTLQGSAFGECEG
jgi:hypothetical protein